MASSADPRKRPASTAPEGNTAAIQKRPAANFASMAPNKREPLRINDVLAHFLDSAVTLAKLDFTLDNAKEKAARANREYDNLRSTFDQFPAIREHKTAAKARAEKELAHIEARVQQERLTSKNVIETLSTHCVCREEFLKVKSEHSVRLAQLETDFQALQSATAHSNRSASNEVELQNLAGRIDSLEQDIDKTQDELLETVEQKVNDALEANSASISASVATELGVVRNQLNHGNKIQHQNATAVSDCMDRLTRVEAVVDKAANNADGLDALMGKAADLEERMKKVEARKKGKSSSAQNREYPGMLRFRPVLWEGSSDEESSEDDAATEADPKIPTPKGYPLIKAEIERLKVAIRQHTTQINNLTTDDVVQQMIDQFAVMYPQAKNFEIAATNLGNQLGLVSNQVARVGQQVEGLGQRVDRHDQAVKDGQNAMTKLGGDVVDLSKGIKQLNARLDTMI